MLGLSNNADGAEQGYNLYYQSFSTRENDNNDGMGCSIRNQLFVLIRPMAGNDSSKHPPQQTTFQCSITEAQAMQACANYAAGLPSVYYSFNLWFEAANWQCRTVRSLTILTNFPSLANQRLQSAITISQFYDSNLDTAAFNLDDSGIKQSFGYSAGNDVHDL